MVVIGPDSYIMTSEGLKATGDYIEALQYSYDTLQTFSMNSNGVLCEGVYDMNYKHKCFIGSIGRYKVKTEMLGDQHTYIYDMVTDGFDWRYPEVGSEVYRVVVEEDVPMPVIDRFTSVEKEILSNDSLKQHGRLLKPPIGIIINSFAVRSSY